VASDAVGPVQIICCNEELRELEQAMSCLPYDQREVIVLHLHGNMTFEQIAIFQEISIKTVQSRYRYGLDKLRAILKTRVQKCETQIR
jgi:RNA polymerase sigma-70 factor (ECF subfamily)